MRVRRPFRFKGVSTIGGGRRYERCDGIALKHLGHQRRMLRTIRGWNRLTDPPVGWREAVLDHDPFEGDYGDGRERTLRNEIGVAKRGGLCRDCGQAIKRGELVRVLKRVDGEGFYGGRYCRECCNAMALQPWDGGRAIDYRMSLRGLGTFGVSAPGVQG